MNTVIKLDSVSDLLVFLSLIREKKPITLYYDNFLLFDKTPDTQELMRIISLAQLTEVKIMVQKNNAIEDPRETFWTNVAEFFVFLQLVSSLLGFAACIDWCHEIIRKTCIITLKPV